MIEEKLLKSEEKAVFTLRSLYKKYGYMPFKMSKFEEYELYIGNKDFLVSDRIITFNDTNGRLMALKPDVTLSIIKNGEDVTGVKQKVYYNENVYRVSESTHQFKEIMQTGLECIGDIDLYDVFEAVSLAAKSLECISADYVLEISHLGILSAVLDDIGADEAFRRTAMKYISEKNAHDLSRLCNECGIGNDGFEKLSSFVNMYGSRDKVISGLEKTCSGAAAEALAELKALSSMLDKAGFGDKVIFDFSVVNDMGYYNGIVFKGFLDGICEGVLAGGRYDNLMRKMGRTSGAVGFALYLDLLEQLERQNSGYDVDVLLIYSDGDDKAEVAAAADSLTADGKTVSVQKAVPAKLRYREIQYVGKVKKEGKDA